MAKKDKSAAAKTSKLKIEKPEFVQYRLQKWEELKQRRIDELGDRIGKPITITLPSGDKKEGKAYETTPHNIAEQISAGLAQSVIVAKVGEI